MFYSMPISPEVSYFYVRAMFPKVYPLPQKSMSGIWLVRTYCTQCAWPFIVRLTPLSLTPSIESAPHWSAIPEE